MAKRTNWRRWGTPSLRDVLQYVWKHEGTHRQEIVDAFACRPNRVTDVVARLIRERWVVEGKTKSGRNGRAPVSLLVDRRSKAALAATYGRELRMKLLNASGETLAERTASKVPSDPRALARVIGTEARELTRNYSGTVIGMGVADPGMINTVRGEVLRSTTYPDWRNVPMARLVHAATGLPVLLEDCSHLVAMAQYRALPELAARGASMLSLDFGMCLGCVLVTPDGVFRGSGFAGDVAHVVLDPKGPVCRCGGRGCVETMVGGRALVAEARARIKAGAQSALSGKPSLTPERVLEAAAEGDRVAEQSVSAILPQLGLVLGLTFAAYHPQTVVVGTGSAAASAYLAGRLKALLTESLLREMGNALEVRAGGETGSLVLAGAGLMVFNDVVMNSGARLYRGGVEDARTAAQS